jgi:CheY-like chemotaxis protein
MAMPRMDGYEIARRLRGEEDFDHHLVSRST